MKKQGKQTKVNREKGIIREIGSGEEIRMKLTGGARRSAGRRRRGI